MKAAVIGAGMAGLRLARILQESGVEVHVFDKARGPSGRLATRRNDEGQYDHGAQYFTAREPRFIAQVEDWCRRGVVARWEGRIAVLDRDPDKDLIEIEQDAPSRYVGVPRMSAIARDLAEGLTMTFSTRVLCASREGGKWSLETEDATGADGFDWVFTAVPAPQAVPLLAASPELAREAARVSMLPCHALMIRFETELDLPFDGAFVRSSSLGWAARNASKPGREFASTWVLHSTPEWSGSHLEAAPEQTLRELRAAFQAAIGKPLPATDFFAVHRWLYARPEKSLGVEALWDPETGLGACGDWVQGDRVEAAFLSAEALAGAVLDR